MLDLAIDGEVEVALSDAILEETLRVLRDKFTRSSEQLKQAEGYMRAIGRHITPTETIDAVPRDPDDNAILECAVEAGSETIVTRDNDLLSLGTFRGTQVMTVAAFLDQFQGRGR